MRLWIQLLTISAVSLWAQDMEVYSNSSEGELMRVENTGSTHKTAVAVYSTTTYGVGISSNGGAIYGTGIQGYGATGVSGGSQIDNPSQWAMGVFGTAYNYSYDGGSTAVGVYGYGVSYGGSHGSWGGYFDGNVGGYDFIYTSDAKAKKNVRPLGNALDKVMQLVPRTYEMDEAFTRQKKESGESIGLIAQELEAVFPQVVKNVARPAVDKDGKLDRNAPGEKFKGVSYMGLIPVLIKAMQEQQAMIESLQAEVNALKSQR